MRRPALVVVALLVVALVAVFAWRGAPEPGATPTTSGDVVGPAPDASGPVDAEVTVSEEPRPRVGAAPDPEPEPVPEEPDEEIRVLRVLGPDGRPLAGVPVACWIGTLATNRTGELRLSPPDDDPLEVELPSLGREARLVEPVTEIVVADAAPVEALFVDLETGRPLAVAWRDEAAAASQVVTWVVPGRRAGFLREIAAPEGWFTPPSDWVWASTARRARSFRVVVPVPRSLTVRVRVVRADGAPAEDAFVDVDPGTSAAGADRGAHTTADGVATVGPVPFVRGERVTASAALPVEGDDLWMSYRGETASGVLLEDPDRTVALEIRLDPDPVDESPFEGPSTSGTIGIGGSGSGGAPDGDPRTASVAVRALLDDGSPARGAKVRLLQHGRRSFATADDEGRAAFTGLPAGAAEVSITGEGVVPTTVSIELAVGQSRSIDVRERAGRSLVVEVVDARGRPLPGANVLVSVPAPTLIDFADAGEGVQVLLPKTDGMGRCRIDRLPPDVGGVIVRYGTRREAVELEDPTTTGPVRVVVPDADD